MNEDDLVVLLIMLLFGLLSSCWFFNEVVNPFLQRSTLEEYEDTGININATVTNQEITLHLVNLIPMRKSHMVEYMYMAPGESFWRKKIVEQSDYWACASLEPFPQQFSILILPGYPGSGYPERWVRDRSSYFVPGILCSVVSSIFTVWCAYPLALTFAGKMNEVDPTFPTFHYILTLTLLIALGALLGSWRFSNCWKWKILEETKVHRGSFSNEQEMV